MIKAALSESLLIEWMWKHASTARNHVRGSLATYVGILHLSTGMMAEKSRSRQAEKMEKNHVGVTSFSARRTF